MKKEQMQLGVIVGGAVIFAAVLAGNLKKKPAAAPAPAAAPVQADAPAPSAGLAGSSAGDDLRGEQLKRAQLPWKRDPFAGTASASADLEALRLKGISFAPDGRGFVSINDVIVSVGESVADFTVRQIEKDRVLLEKDGQSFYLVFSETSNP